MNTFILILALMLPGMERPMIQQTPVATLEECLVQAAEALEVSAAHEGEAFQMSAACKITGTKADPA